MFDRELRRFANTMLCHNRNDTVRINELNILVGKTALLYMDEKVQNREAYGDVLKNIRDVEFNVNYPEKPLKYDDLSEVLYRIRDGKKEAKVKKIPARKQTSLADFWPEDCDEQEPDTTPREVRLRNLSERKAGKCMSTPISIDVDSYVCEDNDEEIDTSILYMEPKQVISEIMTRFDGDVVTDIDMDGVEHMFDYFLEKDKTDKYEDIRWTIIDLETTKRLKGEDLLYSDIKPHLLPIIDESISKEDDVMTFGEEYFMSPLIIVKKDGDSYKVTYDSKELLEFKRFGKIKLTKCMKRNRFYNTNDALIKVHDTMIEEFVEAVKDFVEGDS